MPTPNRAGGRGSQRKMGSRSSRFFVVVLHLVGVSYPSGIVAVLPWPVALEPMNLFQRSQETTTDDDPIWLQDSRDGSCLGPTGTFTECGDATLWLVSTTKSSSQQDTTAFAFAVLDRDHESSYQESPRERKKRQQQAECLDKTITDEIAVSRCRTQHTRGVRFWRPKARTASSLWRLNEDGTLQPEYPNGDDEKTQCLQRANNDQAVFGECDDTSANDHYTPPVHFTFLRYKTVTDPHHRKQSSVATASFKKLAHLGQAMKLTTDDEGSSSPKPGHKMQPQLPTLRMEPAMFPEMKDTSTLLFPRVQQTQSKNKNSSPFHVRLLTNSNPLLLAGKPLHSKKQPLLNSNSNPSPQTLTAPSVADSIASKILRIQTHPYLNAAKNEIYTDPQTQLEYPTDLNNYLGWSPEAGRQTLTGVGIYRKGYVIKVYGVAFYVSKRDVLADPALQPYATLTAEQLRSNTDFYHVLRKMGTRETGNYFDRTILLKTNMQLSAETMRSSLQADWSYLTEEAKVLLASTGMQDLPADAVMLKQIESPDNPSRCSCSQTAPPEYKANPECCARGTELGFTWTKQNSLQVRLNGRLMADFARPDIAEGIFYEYLRYDDPISPEFRDRVVDGFPFLLGPLSRGLNNSPSTSAAHKPSQEGGNGVLHALATFADSCKSQTIEMAGHAGRTVRDHTGHAARVVGDTTMDVGRELDRRRALLVKHSMFASQVLMKLVARDEETLQAVSQWISGEQQHPPDIPEQEETTLLTPPLPRLAYYAPDEIGPLQFESSINRGVLALVHFYLLLLFIVSFPGSQYRIILRKTPRRRHFDDEDSSQEEDTIMPLSLPTSPTTTERRHCQHYLQHRDTLQQKSSVLYFW